MSDLRKRRLAENQALFRELNERIGASAEAQGEDTHAYEFICECASMECFERFELRLDEYRRIRERDRRFAVLRGHEVPEIEVVVERLGDVLVVEHRTEAAA